MSANGARQEGGKETGRTADFNTGRIRDHLVEPFHWTSKETEAQRDRGLPQGS